MATGIRIGQLLEGKLGSYLVSAQVAKDIWTATRSNPQGGRVIIKTAPKERLENERNVLRHFQGHPHIRQLLDETRDPPSMVLKYLDANLLDASGEKSIEGLDVKFVAKGILQALQALHEDGYTHTDIKPDNILVNNSKGPLRFSDVQLADCGDVCRIDPGDVLKIEDYGPHMGAAIFRSPEAMLNLRWGPSTDIWSFGATLISLIWGLHYHIFKPDTKDATIDDESFLMHVLIRQIAVFGPCPASYDSLIAKEDDARWDALGGAVQFIMDNNRIKPFALANDECLTEADKRFILRIMKLDPRDRPSARELLEDEWFDDVPYAELQ
ncbi:hypothetical protein G7Y89_g3721 [Cudoniella acicularis]|uniref:Protein kinase domain-containing protein n=1 Tax=Cudoniella acicularis TaxID=354080 RepID=A0A8H4RRN3_9HELO|nr:hypothetical protein G7Y89_g3721 [Cudoniella acicularis]